MATKKRLTKTARTGKDITFAATGDATVTVTETETTQTVTIGASASSGGVSDGDKGDITVSGSGTVWNIDAGAVTTTELGGDITTAGKALLDDANAAAQRTTLGIGTAGGVTLVIENLTSDPGSPTTGQIWLRTDL